MLFSCCIQSYWALLSTLFFVYAWASPSVVLRNPGSHVVCHDFDFVVQTSARNDSGVLIPALTNHISAAYCPPTNIVKDRNSTVQLLLHGAMFTKYYWSALGPVGSGYHEQTYSWVDYFRSQGYHTVAIDRLGAGNSSHPLSSHVTASVENDMHVSLISQLRTGLPFTVPFHTVIIAAHSYASFLADILLTTRPTLANATILTGYAHNFRSAAAAATKQHIAPARQVFPHRFAHLDPGYTTQADLQAVRTDWFGRTGTFDPALPALEFAHEDAQPAGELASIGALLAGSFATQPNTAYAGPLALVVGAQDMPFCDGDCGTGAENILANSSVIYPRVKELALMTVAETGHLLNFHYSAPATFRWVERWLAGVGL